MKKIITWWKSPAKKPYLPTKGSRVLYAVLETISVQIRAAEVRDLKKRIEELERKAGIRPTEADIQAYVDRKFSEARLNRKQVVDLINSGDDKATL